MGPIAVEGLVTQQNHDFEVVAAEGLERAGDGEGERGVGHAIDRLEGGWIYGSIVLFLGMENGGCGVGREE